MIEMNRLKLSVYQTFPNLLNIRIGGSRTITFKRRLF